MEIFFTEIKYGKEFSIQIKTHTQENNGTVASKARTVK
jgi:hypothetical protein